MPLTFLKPKDVKKIKPAVKVYPGGREVCDLTTEAGRSEYARRKELMWKRQKGRCCLERFIEGCPGKLRLCESVYEHEHGKGFGGSIRDDRTEINGKWINGVAHFRCNSLKGSRRISYNA